MILSSFSTLVNFLIKNILSSISALSSLPEKTLPTGLEKLFISIHEPWFHPSSWQFVDPPKIHLTSIPTLTNSEITDLKHIWICFHLFGMSNGTGFVNSSRQEDNFTTAWWKPLYWIYIAPKIILTNWLNLTKLAWFWMLMLRAEIQLKGAVKDRKWQYQYFHIDAPLNINCTPLLSFLSCKWYQYDYNLMQNRICAHCSLRSLSYGW